MLLNKNDTVHIKHELIRKSIHLACTILPLIYWLYLSREQIIIICGFITVGFITGEILRFKNKKFSYWFERIFFKLLRDDEKKNKITGATYLFVSLTIIFIFFEKHVSIPAALILTLADSFAAIIGKTYGRTKFLNKTVTGSLTFFLVGFVILFTLLPGLGWLSLVVVLLLTFIEALPIPVSDNLTLPISACLLIEVMLYRVL